MTRYLVFNQTQLSGSLNPYIAGALHAQKGNIFQACLTHDWTSEQEVGRLIENQIDLFERDIVNKFLNNVWHKSIKSQKIRWDFDRFTQYIPYEMKSWDWTQDSEKARSYWNTTESEQREYNRFISNLEPRLLSRLQKMDFPEVEALFDLLPDYLGIQEFKKVVSIPVEWEKGVEYPDGYNKWAGNYTEKVEVARPKRFVKQDFTFDRPFLDRALDLLNSIDKIHAAIKTHKQSHH
jgi:hypothetical protein